MVPDIKLSGDITHVLRNALVFMKLFGLQCIYQRSCVFPTERLGFWGMGENLLLERL